MKEQLPMGICKCGICMDYTISYTVPPIVTCNICGETPIRKGEFALDI